MFTVSYQNLSFEAVTYRPVRPAVSALVVLYCITCSLCLHRCHSNKNDLLTTLPMGRILMIVTVRIYYSGCHKKRYFLKFHLLDIALLEQSKNYFC